MLFQKCQEFGGFWPEHSKVSKIYVGFFVGILKFTEELCVTTMKNDPNLNRKLTCHFKIDMENLTNFDLSTRGVQRSYVSWHWKLMRNLANFHRMKNSDFILESKIAELNKGKNSKQNRPDAVSKLYFTLKINE